MAELDNLDIAIYSDVKELVKVTATEAIDLIGSGLAAKRVFNLVLTGGTLGNDLSIEIAKALNTSDYAGLHVWWSDERFVALDSEERNDLKFVQTIKSSSNVVIHRIPADGDIDLVAESLSKELENIEIDLNIIGVGPDGHIASLFPGAIFQQDNRNSFAIKDSPKPPSNRVTFSLKKINSAKEIWVIASGESKAQAIEGFLDGDMNLPVSHVNASRLLVDAAAFGAQEE